MPPIRQRIPVALTPVAVAVILLHILTALFLSHSPIGAFLGNLLQIFASFLAAACCFQAAKRFPGFSRSFWILVGCSMGLWGIADIGWTYYEILLHAVPPPGSLIRYLFDTHGMFFVMAIFLDQEKVSSKLEWEEIFDFMQISILFFLVYFGMYYLPASSLSYQEALRRELIVVFGGDLGIIFLALLQWKRTRYRRIARLLAGRQVS